MKDLEGMDLDTFRASFNAAVKELAQDIASGFERYHAAGDPACRLDGVIEQLMAVTRFSEKLVDPPALLLPLRDHLYELQDRQMSRHGNGRDPVGVGQMVRRARAATLMQLEFEDRGCKGEDTAARAAADAFPGISWGQIKSWRKRVQAREPHDQELKAAYEQSLEFWRSQGQTPGQAAAALKKALKS